jgi:hypothetical protein
MEVTTEDEEATELLVARRSLPVEPLSLNVLRAAGVNGVESGLRRERVAKGGAAVVAAGEVRRRQNLTPNGLASG